MKPSERSPLIILTCMRSFSSLISNMLGQHPGILALPEVNPFLDDSLGQFSERFRHRRPRTLHGLLRAIAELHDGVQDDAAIARAKEWVAERHDWSAVQLFDHLSVRAAPKIIADKSPSTVLKDSSLSRAIGMFPKARFLHLYRHPISTTKSIAAITGAGSGVEDRRHTDPERSWFGINHRIVTALQQVPSHQVMHVRGEDVLAEPDVFLTQICEWLELNVCKEDLVAMKQPERSPFARLGPPSAPFGNDVNFLRNPGYTARKADLPRLDEKLSWARQERRLKSETIQLAIQLGYADPQGATALNA